MGLRRFWGFLTRATTLLVVLAFAQVVLLVLIWDGGNDPQSFTFTAAGHVLLAVILSFFVAFRSWSAMDRLRVSFPFLVPAAAVAFIGSSNSLVLTQAAGGTPVAFQLYILFGIDFALLAPLLFTLTIYSLVLLAVAKANAASGTGGRSAAAASRRAQAASSAYPNAVSEPVPEMETSPAAQIVVRILEELIRETKSRARFVLVVIFVLLVAAVGVIVFAARITSLDVDAGQSVNNLGRKLATKENELGELQAARAQALSRQDQNFSDLSNAGLPVRREAGRKIEYSANEFAATVASIAEVVEKHRSDPRLDSILSLTSFKAFVVVRVKETRGELTEEEIAKDPIDQRRYVVSYLNDLLLKTDIENRRIDEIPAEIQLVRERIAELRKSSDDADKEQQAAAAKKGEQTFEFLIASGITRFGIVAIIVYIIQILVSLYRYNMRLSHFYSSRMQAFLVGERDGRSIDFYGEFFDSQTVGFGKDVASPTAEISDLIKKGFEEAGKVASRGGAKAGV